jgi:acetyl-CoA carboxylase carboxyl transferase subunit beta
MVFYRDLEANQWVVPNSGYHMKIKARDRLATFMDDGKYDEVPLPQVTPDPLKFRDSKRYVDRLKEGRAKTGMDDAVLVVTGKVGGHEMTVAVQEFEFMAGSLGMAAGEAIIRAFETAVDRKTPLVIFVTSGGARMQEGIMSLMQLPRTTVAVQRLKEKGLPYIVVFTNPTTGGVTASYAMLGDVHIAEPGALICFAGPRVIQQTIREQLPEGFQKAEYLLAHGMVDMVVHRHQLRETLARLCRLLNGDTARVRPSRTHAAEDHGYLNGGPVEPMTIESLARSYGDVMDGEPNGEAGRHEPRETTRDPDKPRTRPPRDGIRN